MTSLIIALSLLSLTLCFFSYDLIFLIFSNSGSRGSTEVDSRDALLMEKEAEVNSLFFQLLILEKPYAITVLTLFFILSLDNISRCQVEWLYIMYFLILSFFFLVETYARNDRQDASIYATPTTTKSSRSLLDEEENRRNKNNT